MSDRDYNKSPENLPEREEHLCEMYCNRIADYVQDRDPYPDAYFCEECLKEWYNEVYKDRAPEELDTFKEFLEMEKIKSI